MTLGADDHQAAELDDLLLLGGALDLDLRQQLLVAGPRLRTVFAVVLWHLVDRPRQLEVVDHQLGAVALLEDLLAGEQLGVAAEDDVDAAAGHVRGDGDGTEPARLGHDLCLTRVLLGVEYLVLDAALAHHPGQQLGFLDADRADQHRLAGSVALADVFDDRFELADLTLVDQVGLVPAADRLVRRDRDHTELVGVHELSGLGGGRARHAGELVVHAEVVLECDRGERLVLLLDLHPFLGLDRLVDSFRPAPALEDAAGELVDDLHLAALDDVVLVAAVQLLRLEGDRELMDEVGRDVVVEVLHTERPLDLVDAVLERDDGALVLLDLVVDVTLERSHDRGEPVVQLGGVTDTTGDDQRRASLVDEDRVNLVHDAVAVAALDLGGELLRHVVAQVVEAHLVVGAVRDV